MNIDNDAHRTTKKILIVEDNPATRKILVRIVREIGHLPVTACSGEEAKTCLALDQFDLCLLDLNLPDITGQRLCRYIRARTTMPLIVLSAEDDVEIIVNLLEIGADDYIVKPANFSVVKVTILAQMRRASLAKPTVKKQKAYDPFFHLSFLDTRPLRNSRLH